MSAKYILNSITLQIKFKSTYLLGQYNSKSMTNDCQDFSLVSESKAVGIKAKHNVITSKASQQSCSSSTSGLLLVLAVCNISAMSKLIDVHL